MGLSQRTPKSSVNDVLTFLIDELESSSRCLGYRPKHPKLLMNGFIIDHESVHLILKEFHLLAVEQKARHSLTRWAYALPAPTTLST